MKQLSLMALCIAAGSASSAASGQEAKPEGPKPEPVQVTWLGVTTRYPTNAEAAELGLPRVIRIQGQIVTEVAAQSPAEKAGLEPGDVVLKLDGNRIFSQDDIDDFVRSRKAKSEITAVVKKGEPPKEREMPITLSSRAQSDDEAAEPPRVSWPLAGLPAIDVARATARAEEKFVLIGLSGAET